MKTSAKLLFGVGLLLLLGATGAGQMLPPPHPVSDFNVQILNLLPNKFVAPIPADGQHGGVYDYIRLRLIPDWKPSAAVPAAATVLKVEFWLEQTSVRVEVQAYFGEMPPSPRPPEMEKLQKLKIASRLVRVDETVIIDEVRQVGIEPFQLKVARAEPWSVGPPEIINKTQALNVEGIAEERPFYAVTVRNVSTKNIIAINWRGIENDRGKGGGGQRIARPILPAKLFQIHQYFPVVEENSSEYRPAEPPRRRQIVITAILFEDGSFEGETDDAAGLAAQSAGEGLQVSRLLPLLESELGSEPAQTATPAKIKAEVEALADTADPAVVAALLARFPGISEEMRQRNLAIQFNMGMKGTKLSLLNEIKQFEYQQTHSAAAKDLRTWLTETINRYKKIKSPYL